MGTQEVQTLLRGQLVENGHRAQVLCGRGLAVGDGGLDGGNEEGGEISGVPYTSAGVGRIVLVGVAMSAGGCGYECWWV